MRRTASVFLILAAAVALQALFPVVSLAREGGDAEEPARQEGEDRWVPSLAIAGGVTFQEQRGFADSYFDDVDETPMRGFVDGDDFAASPFVGGSLELMTPALPIPTRPRLFLSGEILPTFASDRRVAVEGDPSCLKGPEPDAVCATKEVDPDEEDYYLKRRKAFAEGEVNGLGSVTTASVDTLVFGAKLGVAWPLRVGKRQLRIKPSVGWIHYEVEAEGLVVDGVCEPSNRCTPTKEPDPAVPLWGYFRERNLTASGSQGFHGIGPGLDLEMDTGRFGPIGSSIFLGAGAYRVLGKRSFSFGTEVNQPDVLRDESDPLYASDPIAIGPEDTNVARFGVEVDPWIFRTHVGIRLQWLGRRK